MFHGGLEFMWGKQYGNLSYWRRGVFKCHGEVETFFYGANYYQKGGGKEEPQTCLKVYYFH